MGNCMIMERVAMCCNRLCRKRVETPTQSAFIALPASHDYPGGWYIPSWREFTWHGSYNDPDDAHDWESVTFRLKFGADGSVTGTGVNLYGITSRIVGRYNPATGRAAWTVQTDSAVGVYAEWRGVWNGSELYGKWFVAEFSISGEFSIRVWPNTQFKAPELYRAAHANGTAPNGANGATAAAMQMTDITITSDEKYGAAAAASAAIAYRAVCVVCMADESTSELLPCRHNEFCSRCAQRLLHDIKRCPICRVKPASARLAAARQQPPQPAPSQPAPKSTLSLPALSPPAIALTPLPPLHQTAGSASPPPPLSSV